MAAGFLSMGEHGVFIWSAYGVAFAATAALLAWSLLARRRARLELREAEAESGRPART